jgi:hypothetical protein
LEVNDAERTRRFIPHGEGLFGNLGYHTASPVIFMRTYLAELSGERMQLVATPHHHA